MNKNGVELSLNTIAILVLIVIVLITLIVVYRTQLLNLFEIFKNLIPE